MGEPPSEGTLSEPRKQYSTLCPLIKFPSICRTPQSEYLPASPTEDLKEGSPLASGLMRVVLSTQTTYLNGRLLGSLSSWQRGNCG